MKQQAEEQDAASHPQHNNACIAYKTVRMEASEIDELNILEASLHGMERAADAVLDSLVTLHQQGKLAGEAPSEKNCLVLIDGPYLPRSLRPPTVAGSAASNNARSNQKEKDKKAKKLSPKAEKEAAARTKLFKPVLQKHFVPKATAVVKGDSICPSIAAASVFAKVVRDKIMVDEIAPAVDKSFLVSQNKGYPSPAHLAALEKIGPSAHHRMSYAPVQKALEKFATKKQTKNKKAKKESPVTKVQIAAVGGKNKKK